MRRARPIAFQTLMVIGTTRSGTANFGAPNPIVIPISDSDPDIVSNSDGGSPSADEVAR